MHVENTLVQFEFARTILAQKKNTELINADRKPSKNGNLKNNKWLSRENEQKIQENLYLQDLHGTSGYN